MKTKLLISAIAIILASCSSINHGGQRLKVYKSQKVEHEFVADDVFKIDEYSTDTTYGFTQANPIMVGGGSQGPLNERRFLNALAGPNGEPISYERQGSCCRFHTTKGINNVGFLDIYKINYEGLETEITLYINMYDTNILKVPVGFQLLYRPKSHDTQTNYTANKK